MSEGSGWTIGAATVHVPVGPGTPLDGYVARSGGATGTLDPLAVAALAFERDGRRLTIVAADVVAVDAEIVAEIAAAAGVDRSELLVCASHTHAGPAGIVARLHPSRPERLDPALRRRFVAACASVVRGAGAGAAPSVLRLGAAEVEGVAGDRNDPDRPLPSRVSVLAAGNGERPSALLVQYSCHPTVLGADNRAVSADLFGGIRRALVDAFAPQAAPAVLIVNGAAGDVSTRFTRRAQDAAEVDRLGQIVAQSAIAALARAAPVDGPIRHARRVVALDRRWPDEAPAMLDGPSPSSPVADALTAGRSRVAETRRQGAAMLAGLDGSAVGWPSSIVVEGWTLGDVALVAVPGELAASLGARIEVASPGQTIVVGYANGYVGYLPERDAYAAGAYEALASPFAAGSGERVAAAAAELARELVLTTTETGRGSTGGAG